MTDPTIITLSGIVVVAYVRHPLRFYEYRLYSLVAFFSYALPGLSVITVDGWDCHRFISRVPPDVVDARGQAVVLHCEIGRGSRVRIGFVRRGSGPVLQVCRFLN
jgi:hypothetical protein